MVLSVCVSLSYGLLLQSDLGAGRNTTQPFVGFGFRNLEFPAFPPGWWVCWLVGLMLYRSSRLCFRSQLNSHPGWRWNQTATQKCDPVWGFIVVEHQKLSLMNIYILIQSGSEHLHKWRRLLKFFGCNGDPALDQESASLERPPCASVSPVWKYVAVWEGSTGCMHNSTSSPINCSVLAVTHPANRMGF